MTLTTVAKRELSLREWEDLYLPKAKDLKPGDVIHGIATDYTSPALNKIGVVIRLTAVSHRGDKVRLFGQRVTSKEVGREWSTSWISESTRFDIPF